MPKTFRLAGVDVNVAAGSNCALAIQLCAKCIYVGMERIIFIWIIYIEVSNKIDLAKR